MDKKTIRYCISYHPDIRDHQIKKLPFDTDDDFKKYLLSVHEELSINPWPDNKTKFEIYEDCDCKGLLTYPFTYKGHKIRLVYEIIEKDKNVCVYAIGQAAKVDGFIEYQIRKMKF